MLCIILQVEIEIELESEATPILGQPDRHWNTDSSQTNIPDPHGTTSEQY